MYTIIGADGRSYGPIPAEQLRQWLAEGRAGAKTLGLADGESNWRPLATFSELMPPAPALPPRIPSVGAKSKVAAGLLGILLGGWGVHRFYLGYIGVGIAQVLVTLLTCGIGALWGFIEGILIICGSTITTDANGVPLAD